MALESTQEFEGKNLLCALSDWDNNERLRMCAAVLCRPKPYAIRNVKTPGTVPGLLLADLRHYWGCSFVVFPREDILTLSSIGFQIVETNFHDREAVEKTPRFFRFDSCFFCALDIHGNYLQLGC